MPTDPLDIPKFLKREKGERGSRIARIQIRASNVGGAVKSTLVRYFDTTEEAFDYLTELSGGSISVSSKSKDGRYVTLKNGIRLTMNMGISRIKKKRKKPDSLPEVFSPDPVVKFSRGNTEMPRSPKTGQRVNGEIIVLKRLCQEMEVDPRSARARLRTALNNPKKWPALAESHSKSQRWEWPSDSDAIEEVREILGGKQ